MLWSENLMINLCAWSKSYTQANGSGGQITLTGEKSIEYLTN